MKKILNILLFAALTAVLVSCGIGKDNHQHKFEHEYNYNELSHWRNCKSCFEIVDKEDHVWREEPVAVIEPTSDSTGTNTYGCSVCGYTRDETIKKLPDRMEISLWNASFHMENEEVLFTIENNSNFSEVYQLDHQIGLFLNDDTDPLYQSSNKIKARFDFTSSYMDFSNYGDGVYKSKSTNLIINGAKTAVTNVLIKFDGKKITEIRYDIYENGLNTYVFTFSKWGEINLEMPTISVADWSKLISLDNFLNFTVDKKIIGITNNNLDLSTEKYMLDINGNQWYFYKDITTEKTCLLDFSSSENVKRQEFYVILSLISALDFSYSLEEEQFVCEKEIVTSYSTYTKCTLTIKGGKLESFSFIDNDNKTTLTFSEYGTTYFKMIKQ